jgi:hypothetical protein
MNDLLIGPDTLSAKPRLALSLLASYLFFLLRRPVSTSNAHYLVQRIHGLKSLGPILERSSSSGLQGVARVLGELNPGNFSRLARDLQFRLAFEHCDEDLPPDYVVSRRRPPAEFFLGVRRVLLIAGPAIGIGDEIILFPLPRWIKNSHPHVNVAVMSGYRSLWERVNGVDEKGHYETHRELLDQLQGQGALGNFDLVILADFEKPGLAVPVAREGTPTRYLEISLGAQCACAVENRTRRVWSMSMPLEARANYYDALTQMVEWLGLCTESERYWGILRRKPKTAPDPLRVFVSPFTSKYEPPVLYWSHLLADLFDQRFFQPLEVLLDPGPKLSTERFSSAVVRAVRMRVGRNSRFEVARWEHFRTLPLCGVFSELERAHAVVCADSFAAHAAPHFACMTLVIAAPGLKNWRTPSERSFYFDSEQSVDELSTAMRKILQMGWVNRTHPETSELQTPFHQLSIRLDRATRDLKAAMSPLDGHVNGMYRLRSTFLHLYKDCLHSLKNWPEDFTGLWHDFDYQGFLWRTAPANGEAGDEDLLRHFRQEFQNWEHTNLRKYLRLANAAGETPESAITADA